MKALVNYEVAEVFEKETGIDLKGKLPEKWNVSYKDIKFVIKPKDNIPIYLSAQCRCCPLYCCH